MAIPVMSHSDTIGMDSVSTHASDRAVLRTAVAVAIFIAVTSLLFYRSNRDGLELRDFRDAVYYPVVSLLDGNNPYDTASYFRTYPVEQEFPPYPPQLLTVHLPFGWIPFRTAQVVYFAMSAVLSVVLVFVALRACGLQRSSAQVFALATALIVTRPGYWNLAMGQVSVLVAIGTYLALGDAHRRPWLAAVGLAIASCKPTYGVPLAILLLAQGAVSVVVRGALIATILAAGPTWALMRAAGGPMGFIASLQESYLTFDAAPSAGAVTSPDRVDALTIVGRALGHNPSTAVTLLVAVSILGAAAVAVWRLRAGRDQRTRALANSVTCLAVLTFAYHQAYDLVLLVLPLAALVSGLVLSRGVSRLIAIGALSVPAINYLSTRVGLTYLPATGPWRDLTVCSNAAALLIALVTLLSWVAMQRGHAAAS